MTTKPPRCRWKLRELMASHGLYKTSELGPLLADRGVALSAAQVYRLVAKDPERLNMATLAALLDIFSCRPDDLIELDPEGGRPPVPPTPIRRPRRAEVAR